MTMERQEMYIYGILNSNASLHLSIPKELLRSEGNGLASNKPQGNGLASNGQSQLEESESNRVYTIAYQGISALVRDSEIVDYTHMCKDVLARLLVGHQTVIERVMTAQTTIIPMRLGTYVLNETEVRDILSKGYNLIKDIFERISGKIEIDITAIWCDLASIIKEAGEEKEIKEFKEKLLSNPKGITADDQMKIGFMLKNELDKKRDNYACQIQEALKTMSPDFKAHELMDDKMVVNTAFLIDKDKREDFDKKVEELNAKFNEKLNFRCVGPLPAYSFYTLEVKRMQFDQVDLARKKLGILNEWAGEDDIKKAYQRQALAFHPDRNQGREEANTEFDQIKESYNILLEYAAACRQTRLTDGQAGESRLSFSESEFKKNAVLVKVISYKL